jgi:hypothetical protein
MKNAKSTRPSQVFQPSNLDLFVALMLLSQLSVSVSHVEMATTHYCTDEQGHAGMRDQLDLIQQAKRDGVKRFIPSEFGVHPDSAAAESDFWRNKKDVFRALEQADFVDGKILLSNLNLKHPDKIIRLIVARLDRFCQRVFRCCYSHVC